jgi:hypothetical protein
MFEATKHNAEGKSVLSFCHFTAGEALECDAREACSDDRCLPHDAAMDDGLAKHGFTCLDG